MIIIVVVGVLRSEEHKVYSSAQLNCTEYNYIMENKEGLQKAKKFPDIYQLQDTVT